MVAQGIFPDKLKKARVLPIFEPGENSDCNNNRSISIPPTKSKVFERHIAPQIKSFLEKNYIMHKSQSGFREKRKTALIR